MEKLSNIQREMTEIGSEFTSKQAFSTAKELAEFLTYMLERLQNLVEGIGENGELVVFPKIVKFEHEVKKHLQNLWCEYQVSYDENVKQQLFAISNLNEIDSIGASIWTANQLQFARDAEICGHEIDWGYSGRGMYGEICPAVRCDSENEINTGAEYKVDSMGLSIVVYAQN